MVVLAFLLCITIIMVLYGTNQSVAITLYIYTQFAVQSIKRHNYKNTTNKSRLAPHKLTMTTMVMLLVCVAVSCVRAESSTRTLGPGGGGTPI